MQVALISPILMQKYADASRVQLVLPHLFQNPIYAARYLEPLKEGEYRILDNGVAEGLKVNGPLLIRTAMACYAHELVMPDVMKECDATIASGQQFVHMLKALQPQVPFNLAGVVQGTGFAEWMKCLNAYVYYPDFKQVLTVMFPRCMNKSEHDFTDRTQFMRGLFESKHWQELLEVKPDLQVHCLGASPWVREVETIAGFADVRSMDTCLPVALGLDGIDIRRDIYCGRQTDYFAIDPSKFDPGLMEVVNDNCRIFREWARDASSTTPASEV